MKAQTENAVRGLLALDGEIEAQLIEDAIAVLNGTRLAVCPKTDDETIWNVEVLSRGQVAKLLKKHVRTIDYYIRVGLLDRVQGRGSRAMGISRQSFLRFIQLQVVHYDPITHREERRVLA